VGFAHSSFWKSVALKVRRSLEHLWYDTEMGEPNYSKKNVSLYTGGRGRVRIKMAEPWHGILRLRYISISRARLHAHTHKYIRIYSVCTSQKTQLVSAIKTRRLTLFKKLIGIYSENSTKHINTQCEQHAEQLAF
jgi:hypothetical protein